MNRWPFVDRAADRSDSKLDAEIALCTRALHDVFEWAPLTKVAADALGMPLLLMTLFATGTVEVRVVEEGVILRESEALYGSTARLDALGLRRDPVALAWTGNTAARLWRFPGEAPADAQTHGNVLRSTLRLAAHTAGKMAALEKAAAGFDLPFEIAVALQPYLVDPEVGIRFEGADSFSSQARLEVSGAISSEHAAALDRAGFRPDSGRGRKFILTPRKTSAP